MQTVTGGITAPRGFRAAGVAAGVKTQGLDLALVVSDIPAAAAAVFTRNRVQAAPVVYGRQRLAAGCAMRALVVNSGNANACVGEQGWADCERMAQQAAASVACAVEEVWVASTGVIGVPLPIQRICTAIPRAAKELASASAGGSDAAEAIRTTDTRRKEVAVSLDVGGVRVTIGGMAKGSGMIHPDMATLLSFVTTDAAVSADLLQSLLQEAVDASYNLLSVDGDTSTNDTAAAFANGAAGGPLLTADAPDLAVFRAAFVFVHQFLAKEIARDGEGATKLMQVRVSGAATTADAKKMVQAVINSPLVKTAIHGEDANWGRVLAAIGYSGAAFQPDGVSLTFASAAGELPLMVNSRPLAFSEEVAADVLAAAEVEIRLQLCDGEAEAVGWGCDLSADYVRINGSYRT